MSLPTHPSTMATRTKSGAYRFAGVAVRIDSLYKDVHELCRGYMCNREAELVICTSRVDIELERIRSHDACYADGRVWRPSDGHLESVAVCRKIAEAMPARDTLLVHGSCVAVDGAAYLFCAPSGTGKSTHARLWRELLGSRALMVNDDKPLVRLTQGGAIAYGTPWDGKHRLSTNVAVALRAICLLERDARNHIARITAGEAYARLLESVYRPMDPTALALTLDLVDRLVGAVDLWRLGCNMDLDAARTSFAAMSGEGQ